LEEQAIEIKYPDLPEYEIMEKLAKEKSVLGVYVSGHPFERIMPYFKDTTFNCSMLNAYTENEDGEKTYTEISDGQAVSMGGMISAFKKLKTRTGSFMAFVTIEDLYGAIECVCFPKVYERIKSFLVLDKPVSLSGKLTIDQEKAPSIIVERMNEFVIGEDNNAKKTLVEERSMEKESPVVKNTENADKRLWLNVSDLEEEDKEELLDTLYYYKGETEVIFVDNGQKMRCTQRVLPSRALMAELATFLPENCIKLI
jgi:DNA polymerase-3 subunit alpha